MANAGIAAQLPLVGGDPAIFERTMAVNVARHLQHAARRRARTSATRAGYAVAVSSLGGAVHVPLMGAYSASKAAVEALGNTLRQELRPSGARVGVAYFAELDTDMTSRGFGTEAAKQLLGGRSDHRGSRRSRSASDALERGIARRSRVHRRPVRGCGPALPTRMVVQPVVELVVRQRPGRGRCASPARSRSS